MKRRKAPRTPPCAAGRLLTGWSGIWRGVGVGFCEIAASGSDLISLVIRRLDANAVILAVECGVRGNVGDGILVAQLVANILERLIEIVHVIWEKRAAAGFFGQVREDFVALG